MTIDTLVFYNQSVMKRTNTRDSSYVEDYRAEELRHRNGMNSFMNL